MWQATLLWLKDNQIGDLTGLLGVLISIVGFCVTTYGVFKSKSAADRAAKAANEARDSIKLFELAVDFAAAISLLEEIKRAHRHELWNTLPDRYAAVRKILISLRSSSATNLSEDQQTTIQSALVNLADMELTVEKGLAQQKPLKAIRFSSVVLADLDGLIEVFAQLRQTKLGGQNDS